MVPTPPHAPGAVDVIVVDPVGNSAPLEFTYVVVPDGGSVARLLEPPSGPETGGTEATITGSGFTGATEVTFDGTPGTDFTVVDDNTISVTSPPHAPGVVDVVVIDEAGNSEPLDFEYLAEDDGNNDGDDDVPPTASDLDPDSGPDTGGTEVIIDGEDLEDATGVEFDGTPGTDFTVVDDNTIVVTSPPHAAGVVDVVVIHPAGNSNALQFTYIAGGGDGGDRPGALPNTGGSVAPLAVGILMLAVGAGLVVRRLRA